MNRITDRVSFESCHSGCSDWTNHDIFDVGIIKTSHDVLIVNFTGSGPKFEYGLVEAS